MLISPAPIRAVAASTARSNSPGGRALRISVREVGCGSSSGSGSARSPDSRAASAALLTATSSPGPTTALSVRNVSPRCGTARARAGIIEPGEQRGPGRRGAADGVEGEAADPDRPGAGRQPGRLVERPRRVPSSSTRGRRRRSDPRHVRPPRVRPRGPPARTHGRAAPSRTSDPTPAGRRTPRRRGRRPRPAR